MKVRFYTLGCKVNQFESRAMEGELLRHGYSVAVDGENADITIINSCAVTGASEQKAKKLIRRIRREDESTVLLLTGCMAQTIKGELPEVDIILGNKRRIDIVPVLEQYFEEKRNIRRVEEYSKNDEYEQLVVDDFSERTRAFLKIEDGCNRFCSYCIIPYARGRVRSAPLDYIKREIESFRNAGYKEVVIVGINLSSYGSDIGLSFSDAIRTACSFTDMRIRLGSLEPESMDMQTLQILASYDNFCPQFHLSLQSGCDATLKRMNRHYTTADYTKIVSDIRTVFDNPSITTDVMVGFAGETEEEFENSVRFVKDTGFAKVHVFPYSRRPGTVADRAPGQIGNAVKKQRAEIMGKAAAELQSQFMKSQVGRTEKVLLETRRHDGAFEGYTPNYTLTYVKAPEEMAGKIVDVRLVQAADDHCTGKIITP